MELNFIEQENDVVCSFQGKVFKFSEITKIAMYPNGEWSYVYFQENRAIFFEDVSEKDAQRIIRKYERFSMRDLETFNKHLRKAEKEIDRLEDINDVMFIENERLRKSAAIPVTIPNNNFYQIGL